MWPFADGSNRADRDALDHSLPLRVPAESGCRDLGPAPGEEVVDEVIDAPTSAVWQQAANRLYSEQALLYRLILGS